MRLFTYIITSDSGFAPNPFGVWCTLATCKPVIRRVAKQGDWVAGFAGKGSPRAGRLVYAMRVSELLAYEDYDRDPRFAMKKPRQDGEPWQVAGDSIYFAGPDGSLKQRQGASHGPGDMGRDLSGKNALIAKEFFYFGDKAVPLPPSLHTLIPSCRGHRSRFAEATVAAFVAWLRKHHRPGRQGNPPDRSWGRPGACSRR